jgi:toxin-antitoxin system PIN domain toxin
MLRLPDVNVLVPALREDDPRHLVARTWLRNALKSESSLGVCPAILASVVRIVTHARVFLRPTSTAQAFEFADFLLNHPHVQVLRPGNGHWSIFKTLCVETSASGKLIPDAVNAALAIEHGCLFVTFDSDYAKFAGLRWTSPLEDSGTGQYYVMEKRGLYRVPVRHTARARVPRN